MSARQVAKEVLAGMLGSTPEKIAANRARQPAVAAELAAAFRGGRDDLWSAIVPAFPDSMQASTAIGAPGQPTPQLVTESLKGREVDAQTDQLKPEPQMESEM